MALGALDVNAHLNSPFKSPAAKQPIFFPSKTITNKSKLGEPFRPQTQHAASPSRPRLGSPIRETARMPQPHSTPRSPIKISNVRCEKRKASPDMDTTMSSSAKFPRTTPAHSRSTSEHSATGHAHALFGEILPSPSPSARQRPAGKGGQEPPSSQATVVQDAGDISFTSTTAGDTDIDNEDSQLTTTTSLTLPDPSGPAPAAAPTFSSLPQFSRSHRRHLSASELRTSAETLRTRLRVAMFKVQTNQSSIPFSQLQVRPTARSFPSVVRSPERASFGPPGAVRRSVEAAAGRIGVGRGGEGEREGWCVGRSWREKLKGEGGVVMHVDRMGRETVVSNGEEREGEGEGRAADGLMSLVQAAGAGRP